MVNTIIYNYLKQYLGTYRREDLQRKILSSGYTESDFWDALHQLEMEHARINRTETLVLEPSEKKTIFFKIAGFFGLFSLILFFVSIFLSSPLSSFLSLGSIFSVIIFYVGYLFLGKKYNKNFMRIVSIFFIIFYAGVMIFPLLNIFAPHMTASVYEFIDTASQTTPSTYRIFFEDIDKRIIFGFIALFSLFFILQLLFGTALLNLRTEVSLAKLAGILTLVGWLTLFLIVGLLIIPVAFMLHIYILLKE